MPVQKPAHGETRIHGVELSRARFPLYLVADNGESDGNFVALPEDKLGELKVFLAQDLTTTGDAARRNRGAASLPTICLYVRMHGGKATYWYYLPRLVA